MGAAVPGRMSSDHRDDLMVCPESLCPNLFALSLSKGRDSRQFRSWFDNLTTNVFLGRYTGTR